MIFFSVVHQQVDIHEHLSLFAQSRIVAAYSFYHLQQSDQHFFVKVCLSLTETVGVLWRIAVFHIFGDDAASEAYIRKGLLELFACQRDGTGIQAIAAQCQ